MNTTTIKRYSQAFKKQVVAEYEAGRSIPDLRDKYGIEGTSTIQRWVIKHGRQALRRQVMRIQSPADYDQVKAQKAQIKQLEALNREMALDNFMLRASLEVAEEQLGAVVKKKPPTPSSSTPKPNASTRGSK